MKRARNFVGGQKMIKVYLEGGGGGQGYFRDAVIDHFWCPQIVIYWKTVLWIVIVVHFVKHKLPKFLIVYTYIKDQLKKINSKFGQMT